MIGALLRMVATLLLLAVGIVLAFGAGIHSAWLLPLVVALGSVSITAGLVIGVGAFGSSQAVDVSVAVAVPLIMAAMYAVSFLENQDAYGFPGVSVALIVLAVVPIWRWAAHRKDRDYFAHDPVADEPPHPANAPSN